MAKKHPGGQGGGQRGQQGGDRRSGNNQQGQNRGGGHGGGGGQGGGIDGRRPAPYHFAPIDPDLIDKLCDAPVLHDRLDLEQLWTGELRCTLTALTPLLAANYQYSVGPIAERDRNTPSDVPATAELRRAAEELVKARGGTIHETKFAKKKILEPLFGPPLPTGLGPVLIPGSALKGMLRHSLGALLSAPMERVWERTFSYRPNMQIVRGDDLRLEAKVGVVAARNVDGSLRVIPLHDGFQDIIFIRGDGLNPFLNGIGKTLPIIREACDNLHTNATEANFHELAKPLMVGGGGTVQGVHIHEGYARKLEGGGQLPLAGIRGWHILPYRAGLDGRGTFNAAFNGNPRRRGYSWVICNLEGMPANRMITPGMVAAWRETIKHLKDAKHGHLLQHPKIEGYKEEAVAALSAILEEGFRPGDVIFYDEGTDGAVYSIGHHFRYRYRYRDTIHAIRAAMPRAATRHGEIADGNRRPLRRELAPTETEAEPVANGMPVKLSPARLLFGYVGAEKYATGEPLTFSIGRRGTDFTQLAGRIAINMAVEQVAEGSSLANRFLNAPNGANPTEGEACLVAFRPLASPKPSAVEHYLTQFDRNRSDAGVLNTYGDTLGPITPVGNLRGRKFYLHSPQANNGQMLYELRPNQQGGFNEDGEMLGSDQAAFGRFVSKSGTTFRFSLRFVNLRDWELGALLFALTPSLEDVQALCAHFAPPSGNETGLTVRQAVVKLTQWRQRVHRAAQATKLAHKLGHGRPLGLGSVAVTVNETLRIKRISDEAAPQLNGNAAIDLAPGSEDRNRLIVAFAEYVEAALGRGEDLATWINNVLWPWLELHRYAGRNAYPYPRHDGTIHGYHTQIRTRHIGQRKRERDTRNDQPRYGLTELQYLFNSELPGN